MWDLKLLQDRRLNVKLSALKIVSACAQHPLFRRILYVSLQQARGDGDDSYQSYVCIVMSINLYSNAFGWLTWAQCYDDYVYGVSLHCFVYSVAAVRYLRSSDLV